MPSVFATPPTVVPDIAVPWWTDAPWHRLVEDRPTDLERTAALAAHDLRVRLSANVPLQLAGWRNTTVVSWQRNRITGVDRVPLPEQVWLLRNGDDNWFGVDPDRGLYWETGGMGPSMFGTWRADLVKRFDLDQPWTQTRATTGAGVPLWPLVPTIGELRAGAGGIAHALHLVVAGNYSPDRASWVSKSDGTQPSHPLRAGEWLCLTDEAYLRLSAEALYPDDLAVAYAAWVHGVYVTDKTSPHAHNLRMPAGARLSLQPFLTDFRVIATP